MAIGTILDLKIKYYGKNKCKVSDGNDELEMVNNKHEEKFEIYKESNYFT